MERSLKSGSAVGVALLVVAVVAALPGPAASAGPVLILQSVHADSPPSQHSPTWTYSDNPGGTATWDTPTFMGTYSFPIPSTIPAGGTTITISVTAMVKASAPLNTTFAPAEGVSGNIVQGGYVATHADADPSTGHNPDTGTAQVTLTPSGSSPVTLTVGLQDGPTFTYTYAAAPQSAPPPTTTTAPPAPTVAPTPSAFAQPVTVAAPAPGAAALVTSPALALAGAVTVTATGVSPQDVVVAMVASAARHYCYVQAVRSLERIPRDTELLTAIRKNARTYQMGLQHLAFAVSTLVDDCLAEASTWQTVLDQLAPASEAAAHPRAACPITPFTLTSRRGRISKIKVGGLEGLKVSCTLRGGTLMFRVASRSGKPLRKLVGPRLYLGLARSTHDSPGGQLSFTFRKG